jgi:hypothetical protein
MTRARLQRQVGAVVIAYAGALVLGIVLRIASSSATSPGHATYRDLMPLVIALPAALLAFAFQRRVAYLQGLRTLWANMINAVAAALAYSEVPTPSKEMYLSALQRLSAVIEEVRGFYQNVPTGYSTEGYYPFEPLKQIYRELRALGFGDAATTAKQETARDSIYSKWKRTRSQFVTELDVDIPTGHHAGYAP